MHTRRADRWTRERAVRRMRSGLALLGLLGVPIAMLMAG